MTCCPVRKKYSIHMTYRYLYFPRIHTYVHLTCTPRRYLSITVPSSSYPPCCGFSHLSLVAHMPTAFSFPANVVFFLLHVVPGEFARFKNEEKGGNQTCTQHPFLHPTPCRHCTPGGTPSPTPTLPATQRPNQCGASTVARRHPSSSRPPRSIWQHFFRCPTWPVAPHDSQTRCPHWGP